MKRSGSQVLSFVFLFLLILGSCKYSKEYQLVKVGDKFSLMVPSWVKEDKTLKQGANFQYANRFRNFYAIGEVLGKDTSKSIQSIMATNIGIISKSMGHPVISDSTGVTIGGINGARVEIFGNMSNEPIYFSEVVLEGKNGFYHLSIWTRTADRKLKFKDDIDRILNSFKER